MGGRRNKKKLSGKLKPPSDVGKNELKRLLSIKVKFEH